MTVRADPPPRTQSEKELETWRRRVTEAIKDTGAHPGDTTIHHTLEAIMDMIASFLIEGANISLSYNDPANTLTITGDLAEHLADGDPHTQYQKESEKAQASGYCDLDASVLVPLARIPAAILTHSQVMSRISLRF